MNFFPVVNLAEKMIFCLDYLKIKDDPYDTGKKYETR